MQQDLIAHDDFAGTGWGVACQALGIHEEGVEIMPEAIATREANGMATIYNDVWEGFTRKARHHDIRISSPPCQSFSIAGSGAGRLALNDVLGLIDSKAYLDVKKLRAFGESHDPRTALVLTPLALVARETPRVVILEQVPPVLPVWERIADELRDFGYSVETGIVNSEQYGVPQTRRRAILVARWDAPAALPVPTHSRYYVREPERLDEGVEKWISMAEALGWSSSEQVGFPRRADGQGETITLAGGDYRARDLREASLPSQNATGKARSWARHLVSNDRQANSARRHESCPAPTITAGHDSGNRVWITERHRGAGMVERHGKRAGRALSEPSLTVTGNASGTTPGGFRFSDGETKIKVTTAEAAALQSYPAGFRFSGVQSKQFLQIGNAVPPVMAKAIIAAAIA